MTGATQAAAASSGGQPPRSAAVAPSPAIETIALSHQFGRTRVLDGVSLAVANGTVAGIVGENGAGKTTLFNLLSGILPAPAGTLRLRGDPFAPRSYRDAVEHGVSRVFQEQALVPALPVYENLLLGHERRFEWRGLRNRRAMIEAARRITDAAEIDVEVRRAAESYPFSVRQSLEIARACLLPELVLGIRDPIVLLDEPTSALARDEEEAFFRLIRRLRSSATIIFVSHRLTEVLAISDRIHVLKDGRLVASHAASEVDEGRLHRLMVGRERGAAYYRQSAGVEPSAKPLVLTGEGLARSGAFHGVSFSVRAGEIVGIGGLLNSGKSRLGRVVAGIDRADSGTIHVADGVPSSPRGRAAGSIGYVPAERLTEGVIATLPVAWNIGLASGDRLSSRLGVWRGRSELSLAARAIADLRIRADNPLQAVGSLSGGNQQKVVIARWALRSPRLLVLDNPTRGVDAGAREEIYAILRGLAEKDTAILVITDDLPELIGLSDRIFVMREGSLVAERAAPPDDKPSEEALVALMIGGSPPESASGARLPLSSEATEP